ncbi:MAG TPA: hypothetical protein VF844_04355, partial [Ktedonobacteraceae bacterium]
QREEVNVDRKFVVRTMMFFIVPTTCAIVFTILAGLVISYITSAFMNTLVPTATLLLNVCTVSIVIFTGAMYLIVIVGAIIELKARIHYQKTMQEHRAIELAKHRQELRLLSHRRNMTALRIRPFKKLHFP